MRTKKAFQNTLAQFCYEIVAMACGLILPRYILAYYGSSYNGLIVSITKFLDYISILALGLHGATRVAIYKANAVGDIREISIVLKTTEKHMRNVAKAFILYTLIMMVVYPYIVIKEFERIQTALLVVIIAFGIFAEYFFGITYKMFLMANQDLYLYNLFRSVSKVVSTALAIVLIINGKSIHAVELGCSVCFVASPIILNKIVRKKYKIITDINSDDKVLANRKDVMGSAVANTIHEKVDIILLTLFTTTNVVSVYAVYSLVLSALRKLKNVFTTSLEGAFGELWASNQIEKFEKNLEWYEFFIYAFVSILFSCCGLLILPFISIYTRNVTDVNYIVPLYAFAATATEAVFCLRSPYITAVQAAGRYKETKGGAYLEAVLNLIISFIFIFKFGIIGVVIGTFVANCFRTIQYALYISKDMLPTRRISSFILQNIWLITNVSIIVLLGKIILPSSIDDWLTWITYGLVIFFVATSVTLISSILFYRDNFFNMIKIVKRMIKKRKRY